MKLIKYWKELREDQLKGLSTYLSHLIDFEFEDSDIIKRCKELIDAIRRGAKFIVISVRDQDTRVEITSIGIWQYPPIDPKYTNQCEWIKHNYLLAPGHFDSNKFIELYRFIFSYVINKENHGKDQDQLQRKEDPDSRCGEGSVLYCRRDRPQFAAGRHCDQAQGEILRKGTRGGQIYLSTRHPEILGTGLPDRSNEGWTEESSEAPGGVRILSNGKLTDPIRLGITIKSSKTECILPADAYIDGNALMVLRYNKEEFVRIPMAE